MKKIYYIIQISKGEYFTSFMQYDFSYYQLIMSTKKWGDAYKFKTLKAATSEFKKIKKQGGMEEGSSKKKHAFLGKIIQVIESVEKTVVFEE